MATLWQNWAEFQESDDECRRFADAIGFKHCEEALRLWELDYDQFEDWKLQLTD